MTHQEQSPSSRQDPSSVSNLDGFEVDPKQHDKLRNQAFEVVVDQDHPERLLENTKALQLFLAIAEPSVRFEKIYRNNLKRYKELKEVYDKRKAAPTGLNILKKLDAMLAQAPREPSRDRTVCINAHYLNGKFGHPGGLLDPSQMSAEYAFMLKKMLELKMVESVTHYIEYGVPILGGYRLTPLGTKIYKDKLKSVD